MKKRTKRGFTLPEVLVTVSLVAVLAAVVVPAVATKIANGPPSSTEQSATALRGALETFLTDVTRAPLRPAQLVRSLSTTADSDISSTLYTTYQANRWKGPYIQRDSNSLFGTNGFGAGTLVNTFRQVAGPGSVKYITVFATGFARAVQTQVDLDIDTNADSASGLVRWNKDTLFFLLYPVP